MSQRSLSLSALVVPLALGGACYLLIAGCIEGGLVGGEMLERYLIGHPISRATTFMFCVGLVSLLGLAWHTRWQHRLLTQVRFAAENIADDLDDRQTSQALMQQLQSLPQRLQNHQLFHRLQNLLRFIDRHRSSSGLEGELKHQADLALEQLHQRLAFVRILIWATPMLGFLGTVLGISQALGQLNVGADNDLQGMMSNLQSSLYVAFDTTAQALVLSMSLMFLMFFVERYDLQGLAAVDARATDLLSERFEFGESGNNGQAAIRSVGKKLLASTRAAVQEHTRIWKKTVESAEQAWVASQTEAAAQIESSLGQALSSQFERFMADWKTWSVETEQNLTTRLGQWQTLLSESSRTVEKQQALNQVQCQLLSDILQQLQAVEQRTLTQQQQLSTAWEARETALAQDRSAWQHWSEEKLAQERQRWEEEAQQRAAWQASLMELTQAWQQLADRPQQESTLNWDPGQIQETMVEIVSVVQMLKQELEHAAESRPAPATEAKKAFQLRIARPTRNAA